MLNLTDVRGLFQYKDVEPRPRSPTRAHGAMGAHAVYSPVFFTRGSKFPAPNTWITMAIRSLSAEIYQITMTPYSYQYVLIIRLQWVFPTPIHVLSVQRSVWPRGRMQRSNLCSYPVSNETLPPGTLQPPHTGTAGTIISQGPHSKTAARLKRAK